MKKLILFSLSLLLALPTFAQRWGIVKDEGGYTNVRAGAGTNYGINYKVKDGSPIVLARHNSGWFAVCDDSSDGWGNVDGYIAASKVYYPAYDWLYVMQVVQEGGYTNIRKGRGTNYPIVGKVRDGSCVFVKYDESSWLPVYTASGKLRGYMSSNKLEHVLP